MTLAPSFPLIRAGGTLLLALPLLSGCRFLTGSGTLPPVEPDPGADDDSVADDDSFPTEPPVDPPFEPPTDPPIEPDPGCAEGATFVLSPAWDGTSHHIDGSWFAGAIGDGSLAALHTAVPEMPGMGEIVGVWNRWDGQLGGDLSATTWGDLSEPMPWDGGSEQGCEDAETGQWSDQPCGSTEQFLWVEGEFYDTWGSVSGRFSGSLSVDSSGYGWGQTTWQPILGGFWAQLTTSSVGSGAIYGSHWWNNGGWGEMTGAYEVDEWGSGWGYAELSDEAGAFVGWQDGWLSMVAYAETWVDPSTGESQSPDDGGQPMPAELYPGYWAGAYSIDSMGSVVPYGQPDQDDGSDGGMPEPAPQTYGDFEGTVWTWAPGYAEVSGTYFAPSCAWVSDEPIPMGRP